MNYQSDDRRHETDSIKQVLHIKYNTEGFVEFECFMTASGHHSLSLFWKRAVWTFCKSSPFVIYGKEGSLKGHTSGYIFTIQTIKDG